MPITRKRKISWRKEMSDNKVCFYAQDREECKTCENNQSAKGIFWTEEMKKEATEQIRGEKVNGSV